MKLKTAHYRKLNRLLRPAIDAEIRRYTYYRDLLHRVDPKMLTWGRQSLESYESFALWICTPQPGLGGKVPLDAMRTANGCRQVRRIFDAIHYRVYDKAVEIVHALAGHKLNSDQDDYLALMAKLVEEYEAENVPEPKRARGIESLKFLLDENGLSADDLAETLGLNRSIACRILKGARKLTANHFKKLAAKFSVSADLFLA